MTDFQILVTSLTLIGVGSIMQGLRVRMEMRSLRRRVEELENDTKVLYRSLNSHQHPEPERIRSMWDEE